jgi:uncharacterized membrane protein YeaQ/YmgE (transglycosylase-associated protein family)
MISSIFFGLLAGIFAGKIMGQDNLGCLVCILLGLIGGVVGGWLFNLLHISASGSIGQIVTSTVGAVVLLWIWSKIKN